MIRRFLQTVLPRQQTTRRPMFSSINERVRVHSHLFVESWICRTGFTTLVPFFCSLQASGSTFPKEQRKLSSVNLQVQLLAVPLAPRLLSCPPTLPRRVRPTCSQSQGRQLGRLRNGFSQTPPTQRAWTLPQL